VAGSDTLTRSLQKEGFKRAKEQMLNPGIHQEMSNSGLINPILYKA